MRYLLEKIPDERVFLKSPHSIILYSDAKDYIKEFDSSNPELRDKRVSAVFSSQASGCLGLCALLGIAKAVFVEPADLDDDIRNDFYKKASIDYRVNFTESGVFVSDVKVNNADESTYKGSLDAQVILATSGTSGTPKLVGYSLSRLMNGTKGNLQDGEDYTWGMVYDLARFAGLQVLFQAISSGSAVVLSKDRANIDETLSYFAEQKVNCISATPTFWRKVLMTKTSSSMSLKRITLGGEICDQIILDSLKRYFPSARISHIYASTEAGVGFSVKDGKEGFPSNYLVTSPEESLSLKIADGLLWVKSTRSSNVTFSGQLKLDAEGYMNTGDLVEIKDERVLFRGRDSGCINVGGNKVIPETIESVLLKHPGVVQCVVYGKKNSIMGTLVAADVVVDKNFLWNNDIKKELQEHCKLELELFKIPVIFKFVDELSTNSMGKVKRNAGA